MKKPPLGIAGALPNNQTRDEPQSSCGLGLSLFGLTRNSLIDLLAFG